MAAGTLKLVGWSGIIDRGFLRQRRYKEWEDCFKRDAIHQMAKYMEKEGFIDFVSEESPAGFVLRSTVLIAKVSSPAGNLQEF